LAGILELINASSTGGGQTQVLELARRLARDRFQPELAAAPGGPLVEAAEAAGIPFHPLPFGERRPVALVAAIRRLARERSVRIVHTHGGVAGVFGRLAVLGLPVRTVHTLHGIHYLHHPDALVRLPGALADRVLARFTDRIICVSEADRVRGAAAGVVPEDRGRVVVNGVDVASLEEAAARAPGREATRASLGLASGDVAVGCVARLHRQKGLPHLIAAIARLSGHEPPVRALLVGTGPEADALRALAHPLGDRVLFLGDRADVAALLSAFDVFCLPSLWEGLPLALLEAMALGLPVVATAVDGILEVVGHEREGLLAASGDDAALAAALSRLARDPALARTLGEAGRRRVRERFTAQAMVEATARVYAELL
jgi:glycosyltransferase involved in cell wall biosynthesis